MPSQKTTYICDVCECEYKQRDDAETCEMSHRTQATFRIHTCLYDQFCGWPKELMLIDKTFPGETARYHLVSGTPPLRNK